MFYIGFNKLSEFIKATLAAPFLYASPLTLTKSRGEYTVGVTSSIVVSCVDHGTLLYCKIDVSNWIEMNSDPFGDESVAIANRARRLQETLWAIVVERVRAIDADLLILEAAPSFPRDLLLIPGHVDGVTYDKESQDYIETDA